MINSRFFHNVCEPTGPDLGGGATSFGNTVGSFTTTLNSALAGVGGSATFQDGALALDGGAAGIVQLHVFGGLSIEQAAEVLGLSRASRRSGSKTRQADCEIGAGGPSSRVGAGTPRR